MKLLEATTSPVRLSASTRRWKAALSNTLKHLREFINAGQDLPPERPIEYAAAKAHNHAAEQGGIVFKTDQYGRGDILAAPIYQIGFKARAGRRCQGNG